MVENTIGIPFQHFGKSNDRFQVTFESQLTPFFQGFLNPSRIQIIPEFLQRILENVYRGQVWFSSSNLLSRGYYSERR
jgi:hypothetical protein